MNSFMFTYMQSFLFGLSLNHVLYQKEFMAMFGKLQAVVFWFSVETKFEVDTTSIILSYIYQFRNVNK